MWREAGDRAQYVDSQPTRQGAASAVPLGDPAFQPALAAEGLRS